MFLFKHISKIFSESRNEKFKISFFLRIVCFITEKKDFKVKFYGKLNLRVNGFYT